MIKKTTAILAALCLSTTGALAAGGFEMNVGGLEDGAILDSKFAAKGGPRNCDGENVAPSVTWSEAPEDTQSFALLMHDQTGAHGMGVTHLVAYGIEGAVHRWHEPDRSGRLVRTLPRRGRRAASLCFYADCHGPRS